MCAFKRIIWFGNSFLMTFFLHRKKLWRFCAGQGREIHAPTSFTFNFSFFLSLHIITFFCVFKFLLKSKITEKKYNNLFCSFVSCIYYIIVSQKTFIHILLYCELRKFNGIALKKFNTSLKSLSWMPRWVSI